MDGVKVAKLSFHRKCMFSGGLMRESRPGRRIIAISTDWCEEN